MRRDGLGVREGENGGRREVRERGESWSWRWEGEEKKTSAVSLGQAPEASRVHVCTVLQQSRLMQSTDTLGQITRIGRYLTRMVQASASGPVPNCSRVQRLGGEKLGLAALARFPSLGWVPAGC